MNGKPVIIIGAGGHAKVLAEALRKQGVKILGALDICPTSKDRVAELPIIGDDSAIRAYSCDAVELVNGVGSVGDTSRRADIFYKFKNMGYVFCSVIHPTAVVAENCILNEGVQIMAGAVINAGVTIDADTIINTGAIVDHECHIGRHAHISPGVVLSGGVQVDDCCHIGTGATVIQGINIGGHALVGAGAVVIRDVAAGAKVIGVPARSVFL